LARQASLTLHNGEKPTQSAATKANPTKETPQHKKRNATQQHYTCHTYVKFSAQNLTLWLPFYQPITHLAAKIRFSRRLVLMQKGVSCKCREYEYLFKNTAICTCFWAICSKM